MFATERLETERAFHDAQARRRAETFSRFPGELRFSDDAFLEHESWVRPAFAALGDVNGRKVLDYGCGHGMAAVVLARRGAVVSGFDLSHAYVVEAARRAEANQVRADFVQADAHRLPFADAAFDAVWGSAILHHLDLAIAVRELHRVMRPGGAAVFCEPWGENPILRWARRRLHYEGKSHTPDESPLGVRDIEVLRQAFPTLQLKGHQVFSMIRRVVNIRSLVRGLELCDDCLLRWMPRLQRWSRYVVLVLKR